MNQYKLPPLIEQFVQEVGSIYEASMLCLSYSSNPHVPQHLRDEGHNSMWLYREMLIHTFDAAKNMLLDKMAKKENI